MGQGVDEVCQISTEPCFKRDTPFYFEPGKAPPFSSQLHYSFFYIKELVERGLDLRLWHRYQHRPVILLFTLR